MIGFVKTDRRVYESVLRVMPKPLERGILMEEKCAKAIRVLTVPSMFSALLCTILYLQLSGAFTSGWHYFAALCFLSVLPLMSYPVCHAVPSLREKGRTAERNLSLVFSVAGYVGGILFCLLTDSRPVEKLLYATYLLSGLGLAVCSLMHFHASGHACGCSGPIIFLSVLMSPWFLLGYLLLGAVMWASRNLDRHSPAQLVGGSVVPVVAFLGCMHWIL